MLAKWYSPASAPSSDSDQSVHLYMKIIKMAKIRNRFNQTPHLTQNTNWKVTLSHLDITKEIQEVSRDMRFPTMRYATCKGSDQPAHTPLENSMTVTLLTEHHLEFLSSKGSCTSSSESTLVKIPHCWKSHVAHKYKYRYVFILS